MCECCSALETENAEHIVDLLSHHNQLCFSPVGNRQEASWRKKTEKHHDDLVKKHYDNLMILAQK
jgi:hypothetical protein